jgi:hypothetical protein
MHACKGGWMIFDHDLRNGYGDTELYAHPPPDIRAVSAVGPKGMMNGARPPGTVSQFLLNSKSNAFRRFMISGI